MMKNFKSLIVVVMLSITATCTAKPYIYILNNSKDPNHTNRKILVHLSWKNKLTKVVDMYSDPMISADSNAKRIKVPAGHSLLSIDITPAINLASLAGGGAIAYGVTHSMNRRTIRAHGDSYFVIETGKKRSQIKSQRQVEIKKYKNEQHYREEIAKNQNNEEPENEEEVIENQLVEELVEELVENQDKQELEDNSTDELIESTNDQAIVATA